MIWCVEDDASIREIEIYALTSQGYEAKGYEDGLAFWNALQEASTCPELIILDIMLPGMDGVELLRRLKSSSKYGDTPIIMATAKGAEYDKVQSLDLGADDYLVKPFGMMEMLARVKAVLRRCHPPKDESIYQIGGLVMHLNEHTVLADGERILLTYKEYEVLKMFMANPGIAFTRDQLFAKVWGADYIGDTRTLDMHIRTLRQKLGSYGNMIETVRNVGYRLEADQ